MKVNPNCTRPECPREFPEAQNFCNICGEKLTSVAKSGDPFGKITFPKGEAKTFSSRESYFSDIEDVLQLPQEPFDPMKTFVSPQGTSFPSFPKLESYGPEEEIIDVPELGELPTMIVYPRSPEAEPSERLAEKPPVISSQETEVFQMPPIYQEPQETIVDKPYESLGKASEQETILEPVVELYESSKVVSEQQPETIIERPSESYARPSESYAEPSETIIEQPSESYTRPSETIIEQPFGSYARPSETIVEQPSESYTRPSETVIEQPFEGYTESSETIVEPTYKPYEAPKTFYEPLPLVSKPELVESKPPSVQEKTIFEQQVSTAPSYSAQNVAGAEQNQRQTSFSPQSSLPSFASSAEKNQTLAIVSLVLGILSIALSIFGIGFIAGIPAIITGYMAKKKADSQSQIYGGRGLAIFGMILGGISLPLSFLILVFVGAVFLVR